MRIGIAEDQPFFRRGLEELLSEVGYTVGPSEPDGAAFLEAVEREGPPDVAIIDIHMSPGTAGGLEMGKELHSRYPDVGLLFLSQYVNTPYLMAVLAIGNNSIGYQFKERLGAVESLRDIIERVSRGQVAIEPEIIKLLVQNNENEQLRALSSREMDVLKSMAEGRSNRGIASVLHLAEKTVENYTASIFVKLGLSGDGSADTDNRRVLAVIAYLRARRPSTEIAR